jgi:hypothetical protein
MSNWPRGHADFSSSNWTARTSSKPRDTSWSPVDHRSILHPSRWFGSAFLLFVMLAVIPAVGMALGYFGK